MCRNAILTSRRHIEIRQTAYLGLRIVAVAGDGRASACAILSGGRDVFLLPCAMIFLGTIHF